MSRKPIYSLTFLAFSIFTTGTAQIGSDYNNEIDQIPDRNDTFITPGPLPAFTFPAVTPSGLSYNLPHNIGSDRDCFKNFPHLQRRFSKEHLEFFCQQKRAYDDVIFNQTFNPFTTQQAAWINSLKRTINDTNVRKVVRKEIRAMTHKEWRRFSNAIRYMKGTFIDGVSHYDLLVMLSHPALAPGANIGAAFLPWHREYLRILEAALKQYHPLNTVPYWDSTLDEGLPEPKDSIIWSPLYFGNNDGPVTSGPFRMFIFRADNTSAGVPLRRSAGINGSLITPALANVFSTAQKYRDLTACIDLSVERANRKLHEWIGGSMNAIYYSAQDPISFTAAAYLDYLWEENFRQRLGNSTTVTTYPTNMEACTKYHFGNVQMAPFGPMTNADGLSRKYTERFYSYERLELQCGNIGQVEGETEQRHQCGSTPFLFCDSSRGRCSSKVKKGGSCEGLDPTDEPCFRGKCIDGLCQTPVNTDITREKKRVRPKYRSTTTTTVTTTTTTAPQNSDNRDHPPEVTERRVKPTRTSRSTTLRNPVTKRRRHSGEVMPDGKRKQTSEEDVGGGGMVISPEEGNTGEQARENQADPMDSQTKKRTTPTPNGKRSKTLPDGRRRQTSEEDTGIDGGMILPHEVGKKAAINKAPKPATADET